MKKYATIVKNVRFVGEATWVNKLVFVSRICMMNRYLLAFIVLEISTFTQTDGQTDMARSARLLILIENI